jgi:lipopolysaccharide transport system permease protein
MRWRWLYAVNPMSGAVQGFRWSVVGGSVPNWGPMAVSVISAVILLGSGLWFFRRAEASFADVI